MTDKTAMAEKALLSASQCASLVGGSRIIPESPILPAAEKTAACLIDDIVHGRNPTAADTRRFFETHWQQAYSHSQDTLAPEDYVTQLQQIPHACWRLRDIIWTREILQPVRPYRLTVDGLTIKGEYAVLRSSRRKRHAYVLYLREGGVKRRPLVPDVISFARWLDLQNRWAEISSEWRIKTIGILHYWVTTDTSLEHRPDLDNARQVVTNAVAALRK